MGCKLAYITFSSLFTYKDPITHDLIFSCIVVNVSSTEDGMLVSGIVTQFWNWKKRIYSKKVLNVCYMLGIILDPPNKVIDKIL